MKGKKYSMLALGILVLSVLHFFVSFFISFAAGIGGSSGIGSILGIVSKILTFPLWLFKGSDSETPQTLLSWWPWAALSLTWGTALSFAIRHFGSR